jgi:hypothetical protein
MDPNVFTVKFHLSFANSKNSLFSLLLTGRNISPAQPFSVEPSPAFFLSIFVSTNAGRSQQAATMAKTAVKRRFLLFLISSKGQFWLFSVSYR